MNWKELSQTVWNKISLAILKAFRGLFCEKKHDGWELSKGNVSFWIVLVHCLIQWSVKTPQIVQDIAGAAVSMAAPAISEQGMVDTLLSAKGPVSDQEFYLLVLLLGYAVVKQTKGGITSVASAVFNK